MSLAQTSQPARRKDTSSYLGIFLGSQNSRDGSCAKHSFLAQLHLSLSSTLLGLGRLLLFGSCRSLLLIWLLTLQPSDSQDHARGGEYRSEGSVGTQRSMGVVAISELGQAGRLAKPRRNHENAGRRRRNGGSDSSRTRGRNLSHKPLS